MSEQKLFSSIKYRCEQLQKVARRRCRFQQPRDFNQVLFKILFGVLLNELMQF